MVLWDLLLLLQLSIGAAVHGSGVDWVDGIVGIPSFSTIAEHILPRVLDEALDGGEDRLPVGFGFFGALPKVQGFRQQIDDPDAVSEHVLGVLSVNGRFSTPAELAQYFVGDEGFHHFLDVSLAGLRVVHFLVQSNHHLQQELVVVGAVIVQVQEIVNSADRQLRHLGECIVIAAVNGSSSSSLLLSHGLSAKIIGHCCNRCGAQPSNETGVIQLPLLCRLMLN